MRTMQFIANHLSARLLRYHTPPVSAHITAHSAFNTLRPALRFLNSEDTFPLNANTSRSALHHLPALGDFSSTDCRFTFSSSLSWRVLKDFFCSMSLRTKDGDWLFLPWNKILGDKTYEEALPLHNSVSCWRWKAAKIKRKLIIPEFLCKKI